MSSLGTFLKDAVGSFVIPLELNNILDLNPLMRVRLLLMTSVTANTTMTPPNTLPIMAFVTTGLDC